MSDWGVPAADTEGTSQSPLPAGYGSLDETPARRSPEPPRTPRARPARRAAPQPDRDGRDGKAGTPAPPRRAAPAPVTAAQPPPASRANPGPQASSAAQPAPAGRAGRQANPARYGGDAVEEGPVKGHRHPHQKVQVVRTVRSRRLIRRLDVWTVFKVSLVFYGLGLLALLIAGVIVWNVAGAFGVIHSVDKSIRTLFSLKSFSLHPGSTLAYAAGIGALLCLVGVIVNVVMAVIYNLVSDLVGGLQVVVVSETE